MSSLALLREKFATLCTVQTPILAHISGDPKNLRIFSFWGQLSPVLKKNCTFCRYSNVDAEAQKVLDVFDVPRSLANESVTLSNDEKFAAIFCTEIEKDEKKYSLRIRDFSTGIDIHVVDLSGKKIHGAIHFSGDFGGAAFSLDNECLVYTAERFAKPVEFFDSSVNFDETEEHEKQAIGDKFLWKETFGEQVNEVIDPVLVVFSLKTGEFKVLDCIPKGLYPTQKFFTADSKSVVFAAISVEHSKLGKAFCSNRNYVLGQVKVSTNKYTQLISKARGIDYIRLAPNGKDYYIVCRADRVESHQGAYKFMKYETKSKKIQEYDRENIFIPTLPLRAFNNAGQILFTSVKNSTYKIQLFDPLIKGIVTLSPPNVSDVLLDVYGDYFVAQRSAADEPPSLVFGQLNGLNKPDFLTISGNYGVRVNYTVEDIGNFEDTNGPHSFIMLPNSYGKTDEKVPLVAVIHGGPHSASVKTWPVRTIGLLLADGYAVVQINYPGSIGYNEEYVQELPGNIGDTDVQFCLEAIDETLEKYSELDGSRIAIVGSSYGGFLVTHLAGQAPDKFKAVVALNPVINLGTMFDITDIPDWCVFEASGSNSNNIDTAIDPKLSKAMLAKSPIAHAHKIKTPYLLAIGGKDLRVPPHFRHLIRMLRKNGVENKVLYYPESNHALNDVEVEIDVVLNVALWIQKYNV